jgi:hypothetical protein
MEAPSAQTVSAPSSPVAGTQNHEPGTCRHCKADLRGKNRGEKLNHYKHVHPNAKVNPPEPSIWEAQVASTPVKRARHQHPSSVSPVAAPATRASRTSRALSFGKDEAERAMSPSNRRSTGGDGCDQVSSQQRMLEPSSQESDATASAPAQPPAPQSSQPQHSQLEEVTCSMPTLPDSWQVPFSTPPTADETIDTLLSPTVEPRLTQQSVVSDYSSIQHDGDSEFADLPPLC